MAAKLRAEVKPVSEYLPLPAELPGALRNAVAAAERKWKRSVAAESKAAEERERAVEVLEEALRGAAKSNPSRGGAVRADESGDKSPPGSRSPATGRSPVLGRYPATGRSPAAPSAEGKRSEAAAIPRPASPRAAAPPADRGQMKETRPSNYDSDLDGASESEKEMTSIFPAVLQQMAVSPSPLAAPPAVVALGAPGSPTPSDDSAGSSASRRAKLEKTRGSAALPRKPSAEAEGQREAERREGQRGEEAKAKKREEAKNGGTLSRRGLLALFKREGSGEEEEEEAEMVIGSPVNVSHQVHIGPDNVAEADAVFKKNQAAMAAEAAPAAKKRLSTAMRPFSVRSKKAVADSNKEEQEEDDGFVITGPTEVTHQGHVGAGVTDAAAVADVIDSVVNKERPVDVENVYAEELQFAEEYNPNL